METLKSEMLQELEKGSLGLECLKEDIDRMGEGVKNKADIYDKLIEAYEGNSEQKDVLVKYLKNTLEDDFFKVSEVKEEYGKIYFRTDEYRVVFPIKGEREVSVSYLKNNESIFYMLKDLEAYEYRYKWSKEAVCLVRDYLENKTCDCLEKIKRHDNRAKRDGYVSLGLIRKYNGQDYNRNKEFYEYYTEERLEDLKEDEVLFKELIIYQKIRIGRYKERVGRAGDYVDSIKDLKEFEEVGYKVDKQELEVT